MYQSVNFHLKDISDKVFLVTGGAGFIGSHLVEYLLEHNAKEVRCMDNLLTGQKSNIDLFSSNKKYKYYNGDICNPDDCKLACTGVDYVFHEAALGSVPRSIKNPQATNKINVDGFLNMLIAARDANVKRFVYASSSSVYGDHPGLPKVEDKTGNPLSPYAVSKATNELYGRVFSSVYQMEIIGLRYFNIFGPRQDPNGPYAAVIPLFISLIKKGESPVINGDGKQTRDFTFVENAVQANIRAMFTENKEALAKVYNVAVGENFSLNDLSSQLQNILGTNISVIHRDDRPGDIRNSLA
ncbi:MAG: SDR family oxidoreductase, partial [Pseudomonadota bacterium]